MPVCPIAAPRNEEHELQAVFANGARAVWHEDVFEDVVIGRGTLDISAVLHERDTLDEWLELLDEQAGAPSAPTCASSSPTARRRR